MSSLADRLRGVMRPAGSPTTPGAPEGAPYVGHPFRGADAADTLGGEWREVRGQRFLVVDRKYAPGHRHGHIAIADTLPPDDDVWPRLPLLATNPGHPGNPATQPPSYPKGRMLFVDLETTGLAGGAGTYAFLVGCAWYQSGTLRVRQFFLSHFSAERVLLETVAELADGCGTVVTYNGKSFDLPLIETRFVMHRLETPFAGMPHIDMLHPARRLWRDEPSDDVGRPFMGRQGSCRLADLEESLCGHEREGDVPGFEIPSRYFHFVRSGDARGLEAVMEHNRLDLISLALLAARASQLLEDGPAAAQTAREALGMGRLYERAGMNRRAAAAFDRAAHMADADLVVRADALRACAVLARRERRYEDAAHAWRQIVDLRGCPPHIVREATEALAVHHEHRLRDPLAARGFALQSLTVPVSASRQQALHHRLARLNRKLGEPAAEPIPLF